MLSLQDLSSRELWVLDLDGTLVDPTSSLALAWRRVADEVSIDPMFDFRDYVGTPLDVILRLLDVPDKERGKVKGLFSQTMLANEHLTTAYDSARTLTSLIRSVGSQICVYTSKPRERAERVLSLHSLEFDWLIAGDDVPLSAAKPSGRPIHELMKQLHVAKSDAVYLGDTVIDKKSADAANVEFIWASWGFGRESELEAWKVDSLSTLVSLIETGKAKARRT